MVENISITNFKSVADLQFKARRINLFLGEPNSGKSNILEAIGLFAISTIDDLSSFVRYERIQNIFYNNDSRNVISIVAGEYSLKISSWRNDLNLEFGENKKKFNFELNIDIFNKVKKEGSKEDRFYDPLWVELANIFGIFKPYHFKTYSSDIEMDEFPLGYLETPYGQNLVEVLHQNDHLKEAVASFVKEKGYKLNLDISRQEINIIREESDVLYTFPYQTVSDTVQRVIFYLAAFEANTDSVLLLEEPEANTFPYYTKQLAERIALDENNNQFFIATHNPYLLSSIVEKTPINDIAINIVYMENYKTQLYTLSDDQLAGVLDLGPDVFYNLDRFLPEA